jgi:putative addiction module killer protein
MRAMQGRLGKGSANCASTMAPGYRIYFKRRGDTIIVLLCGGDKSTQTKDIATAKRLAAEYETEQENG